MSTSTSGQPFATESQSFGFFPTNWNNCICKGNNLGWQLMTSLKPHERNTWEADLCLESTFVEVCDHEREHHFVSTLHCSFYRSVVQNLPLNHPPVLWMWSTCQDVLWARAGWRFWPPGCRRRRRVHARWGEGMWRRRWFTLEGKVNSSCCFKSLGKPRPQSELDRASLSECEPEQRYFWACRAHTDASSSSSFPPVAVPQRSRLL